MSGAPVVLVSGGNLPASGIVVSPSPISGIVVWLVRELPPLKHVGLLRFPYLPNAEMG
jgi:hypothetical protein